MCPIFQIQTLPFCGTACLVAMHTFSISRPSFVSESFWCHWYPSMCLLHCLAPSIHFQITNEVTTRLFSLPHQSYHSIINHLSLPDYILDAFCSHWDICALPHLLHELDSHQSPSSLSSAIACLHLFQISPQLHCILECISHTPDGILLVYNLGASVVLLHSSLTSLIMLNAAFLFVIFQRSMK